MRFYHFILLIVIESGCRRTELQRIETASASDPTSNYIDLAYEDDFGNEEPEMKQVDQGEENTIRYKNKDIVLHSVDEAIIGCTMD